MRDRAFSSFLWESLDAIADEVPLAYRAMQGALGARAVSICVDEDRVRLAMSGPRHTLRRDEETAPIELTVDSATLLRILEARCTLLTAALEGSLILRGSTDDLASLHDALLAYVHGAARSLSVPALLYSYLEQARRRSDATPAHHQHPGEPNGSER